MPHAHASDYSKKVIQEGRAKIMVYESESGAVPTKRMPVFYNPRMVMNRNFSVLVVQAFQTEVGHPLIICDPLAGSGVRVVRLALENTGIEQIYANDINPGACRQMMENCILNAIPPERVKLSTLDANLFFLQRNRKSFDYIDIDPFGSPVPFLYNAFHALRMAGGMLGVTATDTALLHAAHAKACLLKYASKPLHAPFLKELGARILVQYIYTIAASLGYGIEPKVVISQAHFVKAFVKVKRSKTQASKNIGEIGWVHFCPQCWHTTITEGKFFNQLPQHCPKCGGDYETAGPAWIGKLFDATYLDKMTAMCQGEENFPEQDATLKLLEFMRQDCEGPLFGIHIHQLCDKLNVSGPSFDFIQKELTKLGYQSYRSHFDLLIIKTSAPVEVVAEILRKANNHSNLVT